MGGMFDVVANPMAWNAASQVTEVVKAGHSLLENTAETPENPFWEVFQRGSRQMATVAGQMVAGIAAQALGEPGPKKVLDIACGSGIYGFSMLQRFARASLVSVDWPNVLKLTEPLADRFGVRDRTEFRPGDIFNDDLGAGYDLVLAVNIYHHFGIARNIELSRRLYQAMAPGGVLIVVDFIPDPQREHSRFAQMFALTMLLWTENGDTYTFGEYTRMLEPAGFREIEMKEVPGPRPVQAIVARK
jgi:cyclopropane fatty-acyl-phospholipid synthase-like methyltransferase